MNKKVLQQQITRLEERVTQLEQALATHSHVPLQPLSPMQNGTRAETTFTHEQQLQVHALRAAGQSKEKIILAIWQVRKGGSLAYRQASRNYDEITRHVEV